MKCVRRCWKIYQYILELLQRKNLSRKETKLMGEFPSVLKHTHTHKQTNKHTHTRDYLI